MKGNKAEDNWSLFRGRGLAVSVGAVMALIAAVAIGCGGGNTGILPLAGVWVANSGAPDVQHYPGLDLRLNGTFAFPPQPSLTTTFVSPQDTLFDSNNNLWVVDGGTGTGTGAAVFRFLFNQIISLNTTPNPPPNFVIKAITGPITFQFPQFAAFDAAGDLWVSDSAANVIFEFSTSQLSTGAGFSGTPAAVLTNEALPATQAFNGPLGIAFDGSGNLWVDNNGGTTIVEITAADLAAAHGVTGVLPNTVLNSTTPVGGVPTINNPWGILFDAKGNMWFTNEQLSVSACAGTVVEFAAGSFAGPGSVTPTPAVVIGPTAMGATFSLCDPNGIAMNKSGDITVANAAGNTLSHYTSSQITSSGNLTPFTFVAGVATKLNAPTGLVYGPLSAESK